MKKTILLVMLMVFCFSAVSLANHHHSYSQTNVQAILTNPIDEQRVILEGKFVEFTRHEHFVFEDNTGKISVEIDDDEYSDSEIKLGVPVRISAKVDLERHRGGLELEVKKIEKL